MKELRSTFAMIDTIAFAYSSSCAVITLYDLQCMICQRLGQESFEDIGIGPIYKITSVKNIFALSKDISYVPMIHTEDVLNHLLQYSRSERDAAGHYKKVQLQNW